MRRVLLVLLAALLLAGPAEAVPVVLNFDEANIPMYSGGNPLSNFFEGVTFEDIAYVIPGNATYPARSPDNVLFNFSFDPILRVDFEDATNHVEFWYITSVDLGLLAYDENGDLVAEGVFQGRQYWTPSNPGQPGPVYELGGNEYRMEVDSAAFDIAYVEIHGSANNFVIDDFAYGAAIPSAGGGSGTPVPEPASALLLGIGLVGLVGLRKKLKK